MKWLSSVPDRVSQQPEAIVALARSYYNLQEAEKARETLRGLSAISVTRSSAEGVFLGARAAAQAGIDPKRRMVLVMAIAGGFAGLAGMIQVTGVFHRVFDGFSSGYGFDAIAVALLGKNSPIGIALAALLFGAFARGGSIMQANAGVSAQLVSVIEAVVLFVIAAELIVRVLTARRRERKPLEAIA